MAILQDVSKPSYETLLVMLQKQQAELEALKASRQGKLSYKISEKGGLCIYGMGRFPLHFYLSQWERLMADLDRAKAFVEANRAQFATKE